MRGRSEEGSVRHARLEQAMLDELGALLRDEIEDPRLARVRLVGLTLSSDQKVIKVHCVLDDPQGDTKAARDALVRATSFLRARLAEAVETKRVPELKWLVLGAAAE
jgi:ribosome-binding factor A